MLTFSKKDIVDNKLHELFNNKHHVCNAPFISLNFDSSGIVSACCMSRLFILGRYPESSIMDIWTGSKIKEMREAIDRFDFSKGCVGCFKQIVTGNYQNTLLATFDDNDHPYQNAVLPRIMEFEMSSLCNYECIMCGGKWSSSIRKNREKLPPLISPYTDKFVDELIPFIPGLTHVRFLGGEPFATPLYYKIWDALYEHNPAVNIHITTNGSIFNTKVQKIIEQFKNVNICISLDSLNPKTYSFIRRNGNLETVLNNIKKIQKVENDKKRKILVSIAACPMIQNWADIPDLLNFCADKDLWIAFNNVTGVLGGRIKDIHQNGKTKRVFDNVTNPDTDASYNEELPEVSISTLPKEEISKIVNLYKSIKVSNTLNRDRLKGLISSLESML